MRTLVPFTTLVMLLVISLNTTPAQKGKPTPSPSESQKSEPAKDKVYSGKEVDVKAKIKPQPNDVPQPGRDCDEFDYRLRAVLRVVLHKSGIVTGVTLVKGSGCSFDKEAIRVARSIKFEPAKKDGQPVSQYLQVEYEFKK
ncbi:MAG: energy transducer TonB [Pyrinomonadaceae bacterium]|nr:energy transducer TonB [Pyrinomonadaceae bacterium]